MLLDDPPIIGHVPRVAAARPGHPSVRFQNPIKHPLSDEGFVRGVGGVSECATGDPNRRGIRYSRVDGQFACLPITAGESHRFFGEELTNELERLVGTSSPLLEWHPDGLKLVGIPPNCYPEAETPSRELVHRGDFLSEGDG